MKKLILLIGVFILLTACSQQKTNNDDKLTIYTSVYPLQYIAEQLLDEETTVSSVYPPGVDAHTYEPAARDITAIAKGDAFFYVGGHMESFTDTIANTLDGHSVTLHPLIKEEEIFLKRENGEIDPHLWLDPSRMIDVANWMKEELISLDPSLEEKLDINYKALRKQFEQLDHSLIEVSEHVHDKPLFVVHGAYRYWEERYGIKQLAIHGMMAGEESSQKKLANIVRLAEKYDIQYVVYEPNNDDKVANVVTEHLQANKVIIHDLEVLTEANAKNNDDYVTLMKKNIEVLEEIYK